MISNTHKAPYNNHETGLKPVLFGYEILFTLVPVRTINFNFRNAHSAFPLLRNGRFVKNIFVL